MNQDSEAKSYDSDRQRDGDQSSFYTEELGMHSAQTNQADEIQSGASGPQIDTAPPSQDIEVSTATQCHFEVVFSHQSKVTGRITGIRGVLLIVKTGSLNVK